MRKRSIFVFISMFLLILLVDIVIAQNVGEAGDGGGTAPQSSSGEVGEGGGIVNRSANVSYNPDLLRAFEDRDYAKELMGLRNFIGLEIINDEVWARVLVDLKDSSGIKYSGTKEEKLEQSKQKDKWFELVTQEVLNDITKTEIKDINKGFSGFGALVTKKGFEELIKDNRVDKVIWSQYGPKPFLSESKIIINADDAWSSGYTGEGMLGSVSDRNLQLFLNGFSNIRATFGSNGSMIGDSPTTFSPRNYSFSAVTSNPTKTVMSIRRTTATSGLNTSLGLPYLVLGANEYTLNMYQTIGFGWTNGASYTTQPAELGFQMTSTSGGTKGDIVFATRDVTTNTAPIERMRITSDGKVGINTSTPAYPLDVQANISGISIYSLANVSATGYITRTSVYDKSQGSALAQIKDADELKTNGVIDHSKFYGYVTYEKTDYNRPVYSDISEEKCTDVVIENAEGDTTIENICKDETSVDVTYPYKIIEEGVELGKEIDLLRQAVYELKNRLDEVCQKDSSYSWC